MQQCSQMELRNYRLAALGRRLPAFKRSGRISLGTADLKQLTDDQLWAAHDAACSRLGRRPGTYVAQSGGQVSLLDVKAELARRMLKDCRFCERQCRVDRTRGETGFCGAGVQSRFFFEQTLWGEELPVIPSHEIFFCGCNLRCKYCYSWESVLDPSRGTPVTASDLAGLIDRRRLEGAANVNLIGGEPTVHLAAILEALKLTTTPAAVVWNSNFLMSAETMKLLDGVVDLFLGDFRFGSDECAERLGGVSRYVEAAKRNFLLAAGSADLIIRHLVVPGHVECCLRPVAEWVAANLPEAPFNLMFQYTPFFEALTDPRLSRQLTPDEEHRAAEIVSSLGLNTKRWNRPLKRQSAAAEIGQGPLDTTITIAPDGRVGIMHLHGELLELANSLAKRGNSYGRSTTACKNRTRR